MAERRVGVEVVADTSSLERGFRRVANQTQTLGRSMKELSVDVNSAARAQVVASVRTTEALQAQVVAYRQLAAAAAEGSAEQAAANRLAERSQKRLAAAMGESAVAATTLRSRMDRLAKSTAAGAASSFALGRSIGIASPTFLLSALGGAGIRKAIQAASDLNEQIGKTQVVFGDSAGAVVEWSETTTKAFAVSQRQALATASTFGALLAPLGITGDQAVRMSEQMTKLGADLASISNTGIEDALDAIRSGLVGESEPLRRYGVMLSEARVQQEALNETGKRTASQLTDQEKVLARWSLIWQQTALAQGDSERSMGRLAEQTKLLQANLDNAAAAAGEKLTPAATAATKGTNQLFGAFQAFTDFMDKQDVQLAIVGKPYGAIARAIGTYAGNEKTPKEAVDNAIKAMGDLVHAVETGHTGALQALLQGQHFTMPGTVPFKTAGVNITRQQRNQFFDERIRRQLTDVQDLPTLQARIERLEKIRATVARMRARVKDVTRRNTLLDLEKEITRQIRSDNQQILTNAKDAAAEAKRKAQETKRARAAAVEAMLDAARFQVDVAALTKPLDDDLKRWRAYQRKVQQQIKIQGATADLQRRSLEAEQGIAAVLKQKAELRRKAQVAAQFKLLGLDATGQPIVRQEGVVREFKRLRTQIAGTTADTAANRTLLKGIGQLFTRGVSKVKPEVLAKVKELLDAIDSTIKDHADKIARPSFRPLDPAQVAARLGLKLTPQQFALLASFGPGFSLPRASRPFAVSGRAGTHIANQNVYVYGVTNPAEFENLSMKRTAARAANRRGAR